MNSRAGDEARMSAAPLRMTMRGRGPNDQKILIADDEQNIVISLEFLMKREGFTVCIANDGQGSA